MKGAMIILALVLGNTLASAQQSNTWNIFARTKFEPRYDEALGEYLYYPDFSADLKKLEGKEVVVEGYYVPFSPDDGNYIILSKFPMSQCFFCGGGGPESVAEVNFAKDPGRFKIDDLITVRGKLKLNQDDLDHLNFILVDAVLE